MVSKAKEITGKEAREKGVSNAEKVDTIAPNATKSMTTARSKLKVKYNIDFIYPNVSESGCQNVCQETSVDCDIAVESRAEQSLVRVKGRLKNCIKFWDEIGVNETVRDWLTSGYKIPFVNTPSCSQQGERVNLSVRQSVSFCALDALRRSIQRHA